MSKKKKKKDATIKVPKMDCEIQYVKSSKKEDKR